MLAKSREGGGGVWVAQVTLQFRRGEADDAGWHACFVGFDMPGMRYMAMITGRRGANALRTDIYIRMTLHRCCCKQLPI